MRPNRIYDLRTARGWSMKDLARRADTTASQISKLEKGHRRLTDRWITRLAKAFGVPPTDFFVDPSMTDVTIPLQNVPLISWVNAGRLAEVEDPYPAGWAEETVAVASNRATLIALKIEGGSVNRIAPNGSIAIVDYDDRELVPNKFYVIKKGDQGATAKMYRPSPPRFEPYSTEPDHPTIFPDESTTVVGRIIEVHVKV